MEPKASRRWAVGSGTQRSVRSRTIAERIVERPEVIDPEIAPAFAETVGVFAIMFTMLYGHGSREKSIDALSQEEDNLRRALDLGHKNGWWQALALKTSSMGSMS